MVLHKKNMKNILIDTVGFCGTHTLSNSLKGIGDIEIVHGTQNLDTEEHIGKNNLTPYKQSIIHYTNFNFILIVKS